MKTEVTHFIEQHLNHSIAEVALLLSKRPELPKEVIINQINGLQRARQKFPFLLSVQAYQYPSPKAVAQSSSEHAAQYKAAILKANTVVDLSGGMGLDSYFFSKYTSNSHYVERDTVLAQLTNQNFLALGADHIECHNTSAASFLDNLSSSIDLIYIDPDRRATKERAFKIDECEPNVGNLLPIIWEKTRYCLIKLSPMLDISQALTQLKNCKEVHVVSVHNDCKEILFLLEKEYTGEPLIKATNYKHGQWRTFDFTFDSESNTAIDYSLPLNYLYEPNSSIMKAGAFKSIGDQFNLMKLAPNTHLYTSNQYINNFPGRSLKIEVFAKPQKSWVEKANVVCRNFSLSPEKLKKKYKVRDGGNQFLYACELSNKQKVFVLCEPIE